MARQGQGPGSRAIRKTGSNYNPKPYRGRTPPPPKKRDCCPMVAAVRSAKRGKFRLARRYAAMSARLIVQRSRRDVAWP